MFHAAIAHAQSIAQLAELLRAGILTAESHAEAVLRVMALAEGSVGPSASMPSPTAVPTPSRAPVQASPALVLRPPRPQEHTEAAPMSAATPLVRPRPQPRPPTAPQPATKKQKQTTLGAFGARVFITTSKGRVEQKLPTIYEGSDTPIILPCDWCDKTFKNAGALAQHKHHAHQAAMDAVAAKGQEVI